MKHKIYCSVCQTKFIYSGQPEPGQKVECSICGAELKIKQIEPEITAERYIKDPEEEIRRRVDNYARLRGYIFNEDKELVLEGLIEKNRLFGDFYCPCRIDNIAENVCPCKATRMNEVRKLGRCY